ncbi:hypothetical protein [Streptomyces sp. NPDC059816]|uniref:hypothetical protein n=1 Tax=Streptomyces sp. NPDC059816 TaxID=3346960 RepID=UPI0036637081
MRSTALRTPGAIGAATALLVVLATAATSTAAAPTGRDPQPAAAARPLAQGTGASTAARESADPAPAEESAARAARSPRAAKPPARVEGSARIHYAYSPEDTIRFSVHAEAAPFTRPLPAPRGERGLPTDARGTVRISHRVASTGFTAWSVADVDCLVTGGSTATLTAIVRASNTGERGTRFGISVQQGRDGRPDRLGFGWGVANAGAEGTGTCMAPAPFAPVVRGGYRVTHADLPPMPPAPPSTSTPRPEARRG